VKGANGSGEVTFTGTQTNVNIALSSLTYTSTPGSSGPATLQISVSDQGLAGSGGPQADTDTIEISVKPGNGLPIAKDDSYNVGAAQALTVSAMAGVLANDSDPEGSALTAVKVKDPTHGSVVLKADGSFSYTPTAGYSGPDSFAYKANDGSADSTDARVSLTVAAPTPQPCASRPNPSMRSEQIGPGRLRVTVTAQRNAGLTTNALTRVEFGAARNARVEVPGAAADTPGGPSTVQGQPAGTPGGFNLALPANTQETTFVVQRAAAGDFKVDLIVVDGCHGSGPFKTFVGGGVGVQ
jgi:hypothetical protein